MLYYGIQALKVHLGNKNCKKVEKTMARPVLDSVDMRLSGWKDKINDNFEKLYGAPFPFPVLTQAVPGIFDQDARLFDQCIGVFGEILYVSDGVNWIETDHENLDFIADLNPGTATLNDVLVAYNGLLVDLRAKGWIASS